MTYPRVLVVANNSFSLTNSNGRTLGNFFIGWPKSCLAQFCISTDGPNYDLCENYYYVSDKQALKAAMLRSSVSGKMPTKCQQKAPVSDVKIRKTAFTSIVRSLIWNSGFWKQKSFATWCDEFNPEVILLQSGDSMFMLKIATDLSCKFNVPLLIFNSESYYFKDINFMGSSVVAKLWYKLYIHLYRKQFVKTINQASYSIYANELLKHDYDQQFHKPSCILYTSTEVTYKTKPWNSASPRFVYLGSLGLGRHVSLIEIANVLQTINPTYKLEVYGNMPETDIQTVFKNCSGIEYKGFVNYQEVIHIMHAADVLFHVELFSDFAEYDLKYAFSTKIADSLACGTNFLIYAPASLACTKYLSENKCAWVVSAKEMLIPTLKNLMQDYQSRNEILANAHYIVEQNHNSEQNKKKFQSIICELLKQVEV